jgi:twitching motility protein PilJ
MAFKLPKIKLPSLSGRPATAAGETDTAGKRSVFTGGRLVLPLIGDKPISVQLQVLAAIVLMTMLAAVFLTLQDNRAQTLIGTQAAAASELRTLSLQLARAAQSAQGGTASAFGDLRKSHDQFARLLGALAAGGEYKGATVQALGGAEERAALEGVAGGWEISSKGSQFLLAQETRIITLSRLIAEINDKAPRAATLANASGGALPLLIERISRNATQLLTIASVDDASAQQLGIDLAAASQAASLARSDELNAIVKSWQRGFEAMSTNLTPVLQAKQAANGVVKNSLALTQAAETLVHAIEKDLASRPSIKGLVAVLGSVSLLMLVLMVKIYNDDFVARSTEAERLRREAEAANTATQEAILRLMNEMADLADGDLTVRATVGADITGAIADAVNYAAEQLAVLVKRLDEAAGRVAGATDSATATSDKLLAASAVQSEQIRDAGGQAVAMAESMSDVSGSAQQSASVALQSLDAARKGADAVADSIRGMNEIREQIQETSKRIKRLGESSQEIGEIVELISDITEQTNVLALNAAIQAASAGEAGRGFSVVAEEVQRLAERSSEATRQITAIVHTIQGDTHDAVAAMEHATQDVVNGARLSDAAGQALNEISTVSQNLAHLIEGISGDTQRQAEIARQVAATMQQILHITEETTTGTRQTAGEVRQLADLAVELKQSIAGFKV